MINREELIICRRRGHAIGFMCERWSQCGACGMWIREIRTTEAREDTPSDNELDPDFVLIRRVDSKKIRGDQPINRQELEICNRRGHVTRVSPLGWSQCDECHVWLRETRTVEEREDKPAGVSA